MNAAIYPGSFDPVTEGHIDVIKRASGIFDRLYVAVMANVDKRTMFTADERVEMLKKSVAGFHHIEIVRSGGLLAEFAASLGVSTIVKGIRNMADFDSENQMALINAKLNPKLDTVFFPTRSEYMFLSSSAVRAVAIAGGDISGFVPAEIVADVRKKILDLKAQR